MSADAVSMSGGEATAVTVGGVSVGLGLAAQAAKWAMPEVMGFLERRRLDRREQAARPFEELKAKAAETRELFELVLRTSTANQEVMRLALEKCAAAIASNESVCRELVGQVNDLGHRLGEGIAALEAAQNQAKG